MSQKVKKTEAEWRRELTPEQYHVLREKGTERPFTGEYWDTQTPGVYLLCRLRGEAVRIRDQVRRSLRLAELLRAGRWGAGRGARRPQPFMVRTEVTCAECGGHLGHVFDDGPQPTGCATASTRSRSSSSRSGQ